MDMNKPVAWIIDEKMTDCDDNFIWNTGNYPGWQVEDWIPLYTHPVKELTLTIEEIYAVWASGEYYTVDKDGSIDEFRFADFADAILRKVQEQ